jgi:hypothetical protein
MRKILIVIFVTIIASTFSTSLHGTYLVISGEDKKCVVPISENEVFSVSFIHSVELSREIDFYRVDNGSIKLFKTLVKSAGWGLPSTENFSVTIYKGEGWFEYRIERDIGILKISTTQFNRYLVETQNFKISLGQFGKNVEIKTKSINLILALFERRCASG